MKKFLFILLLLSPVLVFAQQRKLKSPQPNLAQLMMVEIRLNPADTIFNHFSFDYLPVKGYPYFTADPKKPFYTIAQRDSIVRKIDELFFEE